MNLKSQIFFSVVGGDQNGVKRVNIRCVFVTWTLKEC